MAGVQLLYGPTSVFVQTSQYVYLVVHNVSSPNLNLQPFTSDFPRADIHELLSPDLLHQVIKGTFKDHIVMWVNEYLMDVLGDARGLEIIADIDHRYVNFASSSCLSRRLGHRTCATFTKHASKSHPVLIYSSAYRQFLHFRGYDAFQMVVIFNNGQVMIQRR
jgi:hypothetical protein